MGLKSFTLSKFTAITALRPVLQVFFLVLELLPVVNNGERRIPPNLLCDVYDGQVWRDFVDCKFLGEPHNLGLMLNIDWFQPFTHTQCSVGVMYLVILNLPRSIRFKSENIIIAGVIPGPKEPSKH